MIQRIGLVLITLLAFSGNASAARYVMVENGEVRNVIEADGPIWPGLVRSDTAVVGDTYDGVSFTRPGLPLATAKRVKQSLLEAKYQQVLSTGFTAGGKAYDLSFARRYEIAMYYVKALAVVQGLAGATWPTGFTYPANDGSETAATAAQFRAVAESANDFVAVADKNYRVKSVAIAGAADAAALAAVDINANWP